MAINSEKAAKPVGKYVHAKEAGDLVFLSGVGPRPVSYTHLTLPTNREV